MNVMTSLQESLTYRDSGVDIDKGDQVVGLIKHLTQNQRHHSVLGSIGGFGSLFELSKKYKQPVLVSGTDGVGTKLKCAIDLNRHDTVGIDLVAMCVNDIITTGGNPLFFLDYFATGTLCVDTAQKILSGILKGCEIAGIPLVGGETAEMPGMYAKDHYDLAGFCVGVVEKSQIIDGSAVSPGNMLIALPSTGPHSNGFSLIRKILDHKKIKMDQTVGDEILADLLMTPTQIYTEVVQKMLETFPVYAMAHITGGGLPGNLPRVLPKHTRAVINTRSWEWPVIFQWLQDQGRVSTEEMQRTFNLGVGFVMCIDPTCRDEFLNSLKQLGYPGWVLGHIEYHSHSEPTLIMN